MVRARSWRLVETRAWMVTPVENLTRGWRDMAVTGGAAAQQLVGIVAGSHRDTERAIRADPREDGGDPASGEASVGGRTTPMNHTCIMGSTRRIGGVRRDRSWRTASTRQTERSGSRSVI